MEREQRYYVAKKKDVEKYLTEEHQLQFDLLLTKIRISRLNDGKADVQTVCVDSDWPEYETVWKMIEARVDGKASPASAPDGFTMLESTLLPDGSGFGIMSFPLPKDHWLYKESEYEEGAVEPNDLPDPILTHSLRQQVIAAIRYAVRSATNCGKEEDFDPDALVQNAVYALCGPYGKAAPTPPVSEDRKDAERLNWLDEQGMIAIGHKGCGEYRYYAGDLFPAIRQVIDQARQEDKP